MKTKFQVIFYLNATLAISASMLPVAAQQYDLRDMNSSTPSTPMRTSRGTDSFSTGNSQFTSSGTRGNSGYSTRSTQPGAVSNQSVFDYRNTTKTQTPGGSIKKALKPTRWAVLGGIFGYEDGGLGGNRDSNWMMPYTPVQPALADTTNSGPANGNPPDQQNNDQSDDQPPPTLHDGTPYTGQMTINDCGGYIGYVPNDFQGSMDDWWHSPYCAYQVTADHPNNIHYQNWINQGSPTLF